MINHALKSINDFIGVHFLMNVFWFLVKNVEYVLDHLSVKKSLKIFKRKC